MKNGAIDITSFLVQDIDLSTFSIFELTKLEIWPIIRYSIHPESVKWTTINDSPEQFNGEDLGYINEFSFGNLYKEIFPNL